MMKLPFLSEVIAEGMWRAMGCVSIRGVPNDVRPQKPIEMKKDPYNHTRWKHMWRWHNRGCFWDNAATEWAGNEDWTSKRDREREKEREKDARQLETGEILFVTFALRGVKTFDNTQDKHLGGKRKEQLKANHQGYWAPQMCQSTLAMWCQRFKCVETAILFNRGSMAIVLWAKDTEEQLAPFKNLTLVVEEKDCISYLADR